VQIPQPDDPHTPITRVEYGARVRDRRALVPYDVGQVVCHFGRVEQNATHAIDHVQQQWQLERVVDAGKRLGRPQMRESKVPDVRRAKRRYSQVGQTSGRGTCPASPPRVLGLMDKVLYVLVDPFQPDVQCLTRDVEKLFDHDAIDAGQ